MQLSDINLCLEHTQLLLLYTAFSDQAANSSCYLERKIQSFSHYLLHAVSPYDTLHDVIGLTNQDQDNGSLLDWGVNYTQIELQSNGSLDLASLREVLVNGI